MKYFMILTLLVTASTETFSMDEDHNQRMKNNISEILTFYNDSLNEFGNTNLNDKAKMTEFLRIAKISKALMVKYLPESPSKNIRLIGVNFAIDSIEYDAKAAQQRS